MGTVLLDRSTDFADELTELRRDLHRHPELAFQETRTADTAAARVEALGWRVRRGVGITGVVAELGEGSPVVALRADMDALPIQEENDVDYRSTVAGVMHACGHDTHVTMLVGAARLLAESAAAGELPNGTIRLLFQPSEESADEDNLSGAARMIHDGAVDGVDAIFGLHIAAHLPAGPTYLRTGPMMAGADAIALEVGGVSAHAARPNEGVDALLLASHVVLACQNGVARRISPLDEGVITLGRIHGGVAPNVVADRVRIEGTIRYFEDAVRQRLHDAVRQATAVAEALGGHARLEILPGYPPVSNDAAMTDLARAAIAEALGADGVEQAEKMMGAEDFALFQREVPGSYFWLGGALEPHREHHHPRFDIDERVLPRGAAALAACAIRALRELDSRA